MLRNTTGPVILIFHSYSRQNLEPIRTSFRAIPSAVNVLLSPNNFPAFFFFFTTAVFSTKPSHFGIYFHKSWYIIAFHILIQNLCYALQKYNVCNLQGSIYNLPVCINSRLDLNWISLQNGMVNAVRQPDILSYNSDLVYDFQKII